MLRAERLCRDFASGATTTRALSDVSLRARAGELLALCGPSGSGKTTLLNLLCGLDAPTSGDVFLDGASLSGMTTARRDRLRRREIALVFQSVALMPFMTAEENVELSLRIAGVPATARAETVRSWLAFLGVVERAKHRPQEMSGGERQRVAIARAAAAMPKALLADEPTSALDTAAGLSVMEAFRALAHEKGLCVVVSTHDTALAALADRTLRLEDGRLVP